MLQMCPPLYFQTAKECEGEYMTKNQQLDFLIRRLSPVIPIPTATEDKWRLFRSLVNVREPLASDKDFLRIQDELLRTEIAAKGITDVDSLFPVKDNLYIWQGDITTLKSGCNRQCSQLRHVRLFLSFAVLVRINMETDLIIRPLQDKTFFIRQDLLKILEEIRTF